MSRMSAGERREIQSTGRPPKRWMSKLVSYPTLGEEEEEQNDGTTVIDVEGLKCLLPGLKRRPVAQEALSSSLLF